jgi:putative hydrolase of the HAD superfamily
MTRNNALLLKAGCGPAIDRPVILFDLGNILVHLHSVDIFWEGRAPESGSLPFSQRWSLSQTVHALETGRISDFSTFYAQSRAEMGFTMDLATFRPAFVHLIGEVFQETHAMLQTLYGRFPLMLLSNTSAIHWAYCRDEQGLGGYFSQVFLSYELGFMKPDPRIYEHTLAQIGTPPEHVYYFDDRPDNIQTARRFGINAYLAWGGGPLIRQLRQLDFLQKGG